MTLAAALMAVTMNAQNFYVGGSLGYSTTSYDGKTQKSTFKFLPEFGIQFNENMGVGVEIGYGSTTREATEPKLTSSDFSFAPYFRYTPLHLGAVSVFADGKFSYVASNNESAKGNVAVDNKSNEWGLYVQPGIAYSLNDKFALVAKFGNILGYTSSKPDADGAKATNTFELLNLANNVQFGFYYNF